MDELLEIIHDEVAVPVVEFILNSVWPIIYHAGEWLLCAFLAIPLNLIEWLHAAVDVFSGVQMINAPTGGKTDLAGYFFGQAVVMRVFWGVTLIAAVLCLGFSIVAVVRSMGDSSMNRPVGKVLGSTAKAMFTFLMVPFLCIFAVNMAGQVLRQVGSLIDSAGTTGQNVYVSSALFAAAATEESFEQGGVDTKEWGYRKSTGKFELREPGSSTVLEILLPTLPPGLLGEGSELSVRQFQEKALAFLDVYDQVDAAAEAFKTELIELYPGYLTDTTSSLEIVKILRAGIPGTVERIFLTTESYAGLNDLLFQFQLLYFEFMKTPNFSGDFAWDVGRVYEMYSVPAERLKSICSDYNALVMYITGVVNTAIYEQMVAELRPLYWDMEDARVAFETFADAPGSKSQQEYERMERGYFTARWEYLEVRDKCQGMGIPDSVLQQLLEVLRLEWEFETGAWLLKAEEERASWSAKGLPEEFVQVYVDNWKESYQLQYENRKQELYDMVYAADGPDTDSEPPALDADLLSGMDFFEARQYILTHKLFGIIDSDGVGDSELDLFELLTYYFNFYSMFSENYFPMVFASWFYLILLLMIFMIFIRRIFELILLFLVSPFFVSAIPLDEGAKFKVWREQFISKAVAGFGSIITLKIFILFLPLIWDDSLKLHQGDVINFLLKLLLMVGGVYAAYKSHTLISGIISERGAASERESTVVMQNIMHSAKSMAMAPAGFAKMIAMDRLRSHANTVVAAGEKKVAGKIVSVFGGNKNPNAGGDSAGAADGENAASAPQADASSAEAKAASSKFVIGGHRAKTEDAAPKFVIGGHRAKTEDADSKFVIGGHRAKTEDADSKFVIGGHRALSADPPTYEEAITRSGGDTSSLYDPPPKGSSPAPDAITPDSFAAAGAPTSRPGRAATHIPRSTPPDEKNKF